jgi:predicted nucleotidyltransferase
MGRQKTQKGRSGKTKEKTMTNSTNYNPNEDPALRDFVAQIKEKLGEHLKGVILFGSRARGDGDKDSDYDLLILMNEKNTEVENIIHDISYDILDKHDALVNAFLYPEEEFKRRVYAPLFINVRREGINLYG